MKSTFAVSKIYFPDGIQRFCYFRTLCTERFSPAKLFFCMGAVLEISFHCALGRDHNDCSTVGLKFLRVSQWCRMGNWGCKLSWMKLQSPICVSVTHISVLCLEDYYLTSLLPPAFLSEQQFSPFQGLGWEHQFCLSWKVPSVTAGAGSLLLPWWAVTAS